MTTYYFMIMSVCIVIFLGNMNQSKIYVSSLEEWRMVPAATIAVLVFLILAGFYTFRWCNGTDFFNYYMTFYSDETLEISFITEQRDVMFGLITYVFRRYITDNFLIYNGFLATLTYFPIIWITRKYSDNFSLSILLYIFMVMYFIPYNTVRQGIAIGIFFCGYPFLMKKKYIHYILISTVAFLFHPVTIIPTLVLLICKSDFLSLRVIGISGCLVATGFVLPNIWSNIISFLSLIGQNKLAEDYENALGNGGINSLRIVIALIPFVLALVAKKYIYAFYNGKKKEHIQFYMNIAIFYVLFVAVGIYNPIFARISQYFEIFLILLYPSLLEAFDERSKRIVVAAILGLYFIYMVYSLNNGGNMIPYQINAYSIHGEIVNLGD